jgi:TonB-dependent receptor
LDTVGQPIVDVFASNRDVAREFGAASPLKRGVSMLAVCVLMVSAPAYAQQAAADPQAATEDNGDAIIVTGIRASLAKAQDIKRDSDTVVDAITSEDIGALPDRSVTEALQRVPGVSINRFAGSNDPDHFSVEGAGVVIRGLNFVRSEFNGRTAFAAGVGGQALNFADVPSELLGSVIVAKNSTAEMVEGGLAGTVNLNTRKPFDNKGFHLSLNAEANYGDFRKKWTPTFSGLISKTWETDAGTFGLLASGSFSRIKSQADGLQITNFQTRDGRLVSRAFSGGAQVCRNQLPGSGDATSNPAANARCGTAQLPGADGFVDPAALRYAPLGGQFRRQSFDRERNGQSLAAQFESADKRTVLTAEFIRSHATSKWTERTFETAPDLSEYGTYPLGCRQNSNGPIVQVPDSRGSFSDGPNPTPTSRAECPVGGFTDYTYDSNNLFQAGYVTNPSNGWRGNNAFVPIGGLQQTLGNRGVDESTTNKEFGLTLKSDLTDKLRVDLDAQYATSRKQNLDVSVFGSTFADQELDLRGDYPSVIPHKPNFIGYAWGGDQTSGGLPAATDPQYFADPRFTFWRAAMDHIEDSTGKQYAFKGDLTYDFGNDSFIRKAKVGARYQDRDQTVRYTTYNWGALSEVWGGSRPVNFSDVPASNVELYSPSNFFRGKVSGPPTANYYTGNLTGDYAGSAAFFRTIVDRWNALGAGQPGWQPLAGRPGTSGGSPYLASEIQPVSQQDSAVYGMLSFGSDDLLGSVRMSGNVGLRYVNTRLASAGNLGVGTNSALGIAGTFASRCAPIVLPTGQIAQPGGICAEGEAAYLQLQQYANGSTTRDVANVKYSYLLPSFNLKLGVSEDLLFRFAASKVLSRADNGLIRNFLNVGLDGSGALVADAGNPYLKPATAWQFDLGAEWYFARVGSVSFNAFYKDIKGFFFSNVRNIQFTSNNITRNILVRGPDNFDGNGKVKGFEVAYQQTYDFLPGFLSGLGFSGNYTYIKSTGLPNSFLNGGAAVAGSTVAPGNLPLEQLSKHNVNAAVFFEKGPVSLRAAYNWRSKFLLTAADVIFPFYSIFNNATGQLDASAFFSLNDKVKIGVQGVNLLNEVTSTSQAYTGDPALLAPRSYFMNDRRFSFVLRANF